MEGILFLIVAAVTTVIVIFLILRLKNMLFTIISMIAIIVILLCCLGMLIPVHTYFKPYKELVITVSDKETYAYIYTKDGTSIAKQNSDIEYLITQTNEILEESHSTKDLKKNVAVSQRMHESYDAIIIIVDKKLINSTKIEDRDILTTIQNFFFSSNNPDETDVDDFFNNIKKKPSTYVSAITTDQILIIDHNIFFWIEGKYKEFKSS